MAFPSHIRSFVRRQSRMTAAQAQALDQHLPSYELLLEGEPLDLRAAFDNDHPIIVEIGYGSGESLLHQAKIQPEYNFIGIEIHRPGIGHLLHHMVSEHIDNIRLICQDSIEVMQFIPNNTLAGIQIFFPDPWQKHRHHKRRLIQATFLDLIYPTLQPGGFIHCATDWEDYAQHMLAVLSADPRFKGGPIARPAHRIITRFEARGLEKGHTVSDFLYVSSRAAGAPCPG